MYLFLFFYCNIVCFFNLFMYLLKKKLGGGGGGQELDMLTV